MPIRLRLTLWNCLLFGSILMIVITVIYYAHKESHYSNVDQMLTNISSHIYENITRQLNDGKTLDEAEVSVDSFSVNEMAIMIKGRDGELLVTNSHPFFRGHQLIKNQVALNGQELQTYTDNEGIRIRIKITPIEHNGVIVGTIETLYSLQSLDHSIQYFKWMVISLTGFGIFLASIAGWFLARKTLRRVDLIGKTAKAIAVSQDFEQRVLHDGPPDELGKLTETFNEMLESLEKAYTNQKRFLSDASHELRAPLTTIRGNLDILYKIENIPELEKKEILEDIRNEAIRMSKLVSDLLSLARADAGQILHMDVINVSDIADCVLTEIESWGKDVVVKAEIQENIRIWGDRDLIRQLLIILLDNAIKYSPLNGSIFVKISVENQEATIRIQDNGIGIQPEELPYIFDRFYRTEKARKKTEDGTGLGLAIAKWIVDEHKGSIIITSNPGEGTEFVIYVPMIR